MSNGAPSPTHPPADRGPRRFFFSGPLRRFGKSGGPALAEKKTFAGHPPNFIRAKFSITRQSKPQYSWCIQIRTSYVLQKHWREKVQGQRMTQNLRFFLAPCSIERLNEITRQGADLSSPGGSVKFSVYSLNLVGETEGPRHVASLLARPADLRPALGSIRQSGWKVRLNNCVYMRLARAAECPMRIMHKRHRAASASSLEYGAQIDGRHAFRGEARQKQIIFGRPACILRPMRQVVRNRRSRRSAGGATKKRMPRARSSSFIRASRLVV